MKLKVVLNKDISFANYLRHVINLENWPWTRKGPLKKVPLRLSKKAKEFGSPIRFTYGESPLKELNSYVREFKKFILELEKLHNREWQKNQKELKIMAKILKQIIKEYGKFIAENICNLTRKKWQYSEVWLVPSIYSGGTVVDNKIFIGYGKSIKERCICLLIHELIHVNEPAREKDFRDKLKLPTDSREIATVLLTNKIIKKLNNKFGTDTPIQGFHIYYKKLIKKQEKQLHRLGEVQKSYRSLIKVVDEFLVRKGYKGYYSRYIT